MSRSEEYRDLADSVFDRGLSRQDLLTYAGIAGLGLGLGGVFARPADGGIADSSATLKVALAGNGPENDQSWETSHTQGFEWATKRFKNVKTTAVHNIPFDTKAEQIFKKLARDGNELVFCTTDWGATNRKVARETLDTKWMVTGSYDSMPNLAGYYVANWSVGYVLGVAAGLLTKTNKLGYVASFPIPDVFNDVNALLMGARAVNPKATLQVVQINSWYDPQAATQATNALADQDVDFVWNIMGDNSVLQAAEKLGIWSAAWSRDARKVAPNGYVSTLALNWGPFYASQIAAVLNGRWKTKPLPGFILPLGQGADRGPWGDKVPRNVRRRADAARTKLRSGYTPFRGPLRDANGKVRVPKGKVMSVKDHRSWAWAVEGVSGLKK